MAKAPRVRPTVDPNLALASQAGQAGYQFVTNRGKPADTKTNQSGFVPLIEGAQYRLVDRQNKGQIAASGVGRQGLQDVYTTAQSLSAEGGKKANWDVEMFDPATGTWSQVARDPKGGLGALGTIMDIGLPIAGSLLLPGIGTGLSAALAGGLGAAAGAATSGAIQGKSLEDIALQAALSGGLSFAGGQLLGQASGGLGSGATEATQAAASEATQGILSEAAKQALNDVIIVPGIREAATSVLPAAIGAGLGATTAQIAAATQGTQAPNTNLDRIVVTPNTAASPAFLEAFAPFIPPAVGAGLVASAVGGAPAAATAPTSNTITVEAPRPTPTPDFTGVLPPAAVTAAEIASATAGAKAPTPPAEGGLLQDIIRYYNLGALGVDTLSGLLGGMQGGAGATSPYASQLGPTPTFGRGAFQPYTGDYETYGFGPEFSFFAPQPANTPSAPVSSMLNPLLPVNNMVTA